MLGRYFISPIFAIAFFDQIGFGSFKFMFDVLSFPVGVFPFPVKIGFSDLDLLADFL